MKRTIEIDDTLQERCDQAIEELKDAIKEFIIENPLHGDICLGNDIDYNGAFSDIVDSNVPVYTHEIDGLWYLHKYGLIEAFENAGFDGDPTQNNGMTAIYLYIKQACGGWFSSIETELNNLMNEIINNHDDDWTEADINKYIDMAIILDEESAS